MKTLIFFRKVSLHLKESRMFPILLVMVFILGSCEIEPSVDPIITVTTGADQIVDFGLQVTILGNVSTSPTEEVDITWSVVDKPANSNLDLTAESIPQVTFLPDALGDYLIRLVAIGKDSGIESSDEVFIQVQYAPILLNGVLAEDLTLENIYEDPEIADYKVISTYILQAALTINPDVKIVFDKDASLRVTSEGSIYAVGTELKPIIFTGVQAQKGFWLGMDVESKNEKNVLDYAVVEYAGSKKNGTFKTNINIKNGSLTIKNTKVSNSGGYGLALETKSSALTAMENTTFSENEIPCIGAFFHFKYFGSSNDYTGNTKDYIDSYRSDPIVEDMQISKINVPYLLPADIVSIEAKLTIDPGVTLVGKENSSIDVQKEGVIFAKGTASERIIIKGQEDIKGYWKGIRIQSNKTDNELAFLDISNGGQKGWVSGTNLSNICVWQFGRAKISNVKSFDAKGYGILVPHEGVNLPEFRDNQLSNNDYPIQLTYWQFSDMDASTDFSGNTNDYIDGVFSADLLESGEWKNLNVPYLLFSNPGYIESDLVIEAGTEIIGRQSSSLVINAGGSLNAIGSESNRIVFRGHDDVQGFWQGIRFRSLKTNNVLKFADVSNGGQIGWSGDKSTVRVDGRLELVDSSVNNSGGYGVYVTPSADLIEANNTFEGNLLDDIYYHK